MTVTYKHTSGDTVICHGLGYAGVTGYFTGPLGNGDPAETVWSVEPIRPIGAADSRPADRGCAEHSFLLMVERRFETEDDAELFRLSFAGTLPRGGVSLLIEDDLATQDVTYATAVLERLTVTRLGVSCDVRFEFKTSVPIFTEPVS